MASSSVAGRAASAIRCGARCRFVGGKPPQVKRGAPSAAPHASRPASFCLAGQACGREGPRQFQGAMRRAVACTIRQRSKIARGLWKKSSAVNICRGAAVTRSRTNGRGRRREPSFTDGYPLQCCRERAIAAPRSALVATVAATMRIWHEPDQRQCFRNPPGQGR